VEFEENDEYTQVGTQRKNFAIHFLTIFEANFLSLLSPKMNL
jgi:hypothetical protein